MATGASLQTLDDHSPTFKVVACFLTETFIGPASPDGSSNHEFSSIEIVTDSSGRNGVYEFNKTPDKRAKMADRYNSTCDLTFLETVHADMLYDLSCQ